MAEENIHIDYLIARHLSGEASSEEENAFKTWCAQSPDNMKYFEDLKLIFDETSVIEVDSSFDVDAAWNKIAPQLKKKKVIRMTPRNGRLLIAIAASLLMLLGIWWQISDRRLNNESHPIVVAAKMQATETKLPDKTIVTVAPNSTITYSNEYGKTNREVELTGNASFEVEHQDGPPFIVKAGNTFIRDIGTAFNVNQNDSTVVEVYVKTGSVMFYTSANKGILLKQGETGIYNKHTKEFVKKEAPKKESKAEKPEVVKSFTFNNTTLEDVAAVVEKAFSTRIIISNEELKHCTISVSFENENIKTVLDIIAETLDLEVEQFANGYLLKGNACNSHQ